MFDSKMLLKVVTELNNVSFCKKYMRVFKAC